MYSSMPSMCTLPLHCTADSTAGHSEDMHGYELMHDTVAPWRVKLHAARRRLMLVVLTVIRLRRGLAHPQRLARVDSFSFYIPVLLGDESGKFAEEQLRAARMKEEVVRAQVGG